MHQLSEIRIQNFRSCRDVTLTLGDCTPIVGYNNAGKSNLLDSLAWFVAPTSLRESDFNDPELPVAVTGVIRGLDSTIIEQLEARHRSKIEPLIEAGVLPLRRIQYDPAVSVKQIKLQLPDAVEADGTISSWKDQPGGIPEALKALFPEPITIGAMEDAAEDATKARNTTTIGKLLAQFTGFTEAAHGDDLQAALAPLIEKLTATGAERAEELRRFDRESTAALNSFFPGIQLHLDIPVPTVRDLFGKGTVRISEEGREGVRDFTALGHGAQRSIQMALIRYLSEVRAGEVPAAQRRLLLVEEPELFLHPQAIEKVRGALEGLSRSGYQVVFATHSPIMVERATAAVTRIVRKAPANGTTRIMPTARQALARRVQDNDKRLHTLFALENANHWLFSDRILIAEGATERHLLPAIYEAVTGRQPADDGLGILEFGGAGSIPASLAVFDELGIEARALADLDFALNEAPKHGLIDKDDADLNECLRQIRAMAESDPTITVANNGRPCSNEDNPGNKKPARVLSEWAAQPEAQSVTQALHDKLSSSRIWLWTGGDIEHHLGLTGSKKDITTWAPYRQRLLEEASKEVVEDIDTITDFVAWLSGQGGAA